MDIDQLARAVKDLEYRMKSVEGLLVKVMAKVYPTEMKVAARETVRCKCGREICRAPDCPSFKPDPMGR